MPKFLDIPQWYNSNGVLIEHLYLVRVEMAYLDGSNSWVVACPMVLPIYSFNNASEGSFSDYQVFLIMLNSFSPSSNGMFNLFAGGLYQGNPDAKVVGIFMASSRMEIVGTSNANNGTTILFTVPQASLKDIKITFYPGAIQII